MGKRVKKNKQVKNAVVSLKPKTKVLPDSSSLYSLLSILIACLDIRQSKYIVIMIGLVEQKTSLKCVIDGEAV